MVIQVEKEIQALRQYIYYYNILTRLYMLISINAIYPMVRKRNGICNMYESIMLSLFCVHGNSICHVIVQSFLDFTVKMGNNLTRVSMSINVIQFHY